MYNQAARAKRDQYNQIVKLLPEDEAITWQEVRDFLYIPLEQMGKLDELLQEATPKEIKDQIVDDLMKSSYAQRLHQERTRKENIKIHKPAVRRGRDFEILQTPGEMIRVAFWFIDKCGGIDNAHKALKAAGLGLKSFE